jgi:tetratricopeptide (TPR) repeat protein
MQSRPVGVAAILLVLLAAILVPLVVSGYGELEKASRATSYPDIAEHYRSAARRLPWRAELYELAGHAYYHAGQYSQAEEVYRMAFQRQALSPEGWVAWGDVLYLNKQAGQATEIWEQGLGQAQVSEQLYSRLSQVYQEDKDFSKAALYLQNYVDLHPQDASARYRLGLLLTLTDPDAALSELIAASELDPELDATVETLRSALNLAALEDSPSARLVMTGRGLGLVQEWDLAHAAFESAVQADEANGEAWAWLGEANYQSGQEGRVELDRALELDSESATVHGLRGLYFERTGNFRNALIEFQAAARLDEKNPAWQVSIGESYSKLGDLIRALGAYQAATALAPADANYWRLLALFCAQNNVNIDTVGIPAAQEAVVLEESAASLDLLGWLLLLDRRYNESERILNQALGLEPQNASVHLHLGMLYMQMEDRGAAYAHFVNARDLGNTDAEAILNQYFP